MSGPITFTFDRGDSRPWTMIQGRKVWISPSSQSDPPGMWAVHIEASTPSPWDCGWVIYASDLRVCIAGLNDVLRDLHVWRDDQDDHSDPRGCRCRRCGERCSRAALDPVNRPLLADRRYGCKGEGEPIAAVPAPEVTP